MPGNSQGKVKIQAKASGKSMRKSGAESKTGLRDVCQSSSPKKVQPRQLSPKTTGTVVRKGKASNRRKSAGAGNFNKESAGNLNNESASAGNFNNESASAGNFNNESAAAGECLPPAEAQLEMPYLKNTNSAELAPSQLELLLRATAALRSAVVAVSEAVSEAVVREQSQRAVADESIRSLSPSALPEIPSFALEPLSTASDPRALNLDKAARETEAAAEWVELYPQGISVTSTVGRPVLVMKDQRGVEVLPVWMNPLDAGIAIAELTTSSGATPHMVTRRMMEALKIRAVRCSFVELLGHHQYVIVEFEGSNELKAIRVRADEAMSFCVQARVKFQATRAFMRMCRDVDADMERLENGNSGANASSANHHSENSSKKHPYVI